MFLRKNVRKCRRVVKMRDIIVNSIKLCYSEQYLNSVDLSKLQTETASYEAANLAKQEALYEYCLITQSLSVYF